MLFYTGMILKDAGNCGRAVQYLQRFIKDKRVSKVPKNKELAIQPLKHAEKRAVINGGSGTDEIKEKG
jgi:hypothetical protein